MSAALIPSLIDYARRQGESSGIGILQEWHDQALIDLAAGGGVALTSISFPGASAAGEVQIPSADLLPALLAAIKAIRGERPEPLASHLNFSAAPYRP